MQDAIAARIARTLAVQIDEARLGVARRAPLASLEVYDCWLRGLECLRQGTVEADIEARRFFERALEIDPAYAGRTPACRSRTSTNGAVRPGRNGTRRSDWPTNTPGVRSSLDETDAMVQVVLGRILVYRRRYDEAAHHLERALLLNPNDTDVLVHAGLCQAYLGEPEAALASANKAMRLNPAFPPWYAAPAGLALFMLGRDRECLEVCAAAPTRMFVDVAAFAAASCALSGDMAGAKRYLREFLDDFQERIGFGRARGAGRAAAVAAARQPVQAAEDGERLARGLSLAGLDADPDEGRPEAVARPARSDLAPATFRRDGTFWTLAFGGSRCS